MANYVPISTVTLGTGTTSIDFTNIPQTYTDLIIRVSARCTAGGNFAGLVIAPNGSTASYTLRWFGDAGGATVSYSQAAFGYNQLFYIPASAATTNTFGNGEITIFNYTSANNKLISAEGTNETNGAAVYQGISAGIWANTAPITSVTLTTGGSFVQYSTATLYGIRKY